MVCHRWFHSGRRSHRQGHTLILEDKGKRRQKETEREREGQENEEDQYF